MHKCEAVDNVEVKCLVLFCVHQLTRVPTAAAMQMRSGHNEDKPRPLNLNFILVQSDEGKLKVPPPEKSLSNNITQRVAQRNFSGHIWIYVFYTFIAKL